LAEVLETYAKGAITGVHILPFFPYSSDDGFSVIDYAEVNPDLGDWSDIARLGRSFRLMFDAVINHISRQSAWFQAFVAGDTAFANAFIVVEPGTDLSEVVRPRALPLLTAVQTPSGEKHVWTTFSTDQIDLNFADPDVLLRIVELLLLYVSQGAEIIRLDAIAYLWKTIGTTCIHLAETHRVVKLFRAVLDAVAPGVMLITETNVPHEENIFYFGDGTDEAQMVYQFPLPPLVLHTLGTGDASALTAWASGLSLPSNQTTFYNFLASHDGVGVRPVEGILTPSQVQAMVDQTLAHGGHVSYKTNADGSESVYELNISYFDALNDPRGGAPVSLQVARFMASQSIMLTLQGVPAIYAHSYFGSRNYPEGVAATGRYRSINREKLRRSVLEAALEDPDSLRSRVYGTYRHYLEVRQACAAFHPNGPQQILDFGSAFFAIVRTAPDNSERVLCVHNITGAARRVVVGPDVARSSQGVWLDLLTGRRFPLNDGRLVLVLAPYQVLWLKPAPQPSS
ncbi:MAG: alpha-glucosidase C-terminal domain-containing protein, partial [Anaerolineae bacterium]|nr:alpha-glucosidase C-terminal domain-containing protein [Anaerolineae bacterium]